MRKVNPSENTPKEAPDFLEENALDRQRRERLEHLLLENSRAQPQAVIFAPPGLRRSGR